MPKSTDHLWSISTSADRLARLALINAPRIILEKEFKILTKRFSDLRKLEGYDWEEFWKEPTEEELEVWDKELDKIEEEVKAEEELEAAKKRGDKPC